ncbi:LuxR family transcriptional regulator [Gelidibacter salicanalis]|uniref:LuxR family transcriptional regulator n=1 Tax=Gelidibacter salicanalis TaxID=291193 RepID=A0A934NJB0_9FLAO|nr:LuxR family transcriptional regulator [Gelidibacter salicanalis]
MKTIIFSIQLLLSSALIAQELPPIITYQPQQYGAENQNWSISQSSEQYIYVANNKGLLEFNGAKWQLYPTPNQSVLRSVKVIDDLIYTGCYMNFGYWKRNAFGSLNYTSISDELEIPLIEDEQFWNILAMDHYVLFQSLNRIYIYDLENNSYKVIDNQSTITKIFRVNDTIYYQGFGEGVYKIESGQSILLIDNEILKTNVIVNMFNHNGNLLIETQEQGFYKWKDEKLTDWDISAKAMIDTLSVYNSIRLKNGDFILGTISNGLVYLNSSGDFVYKIDQADGLSNNTILSLFEDSNNNIWLASDNGINCINMTSALSIYNDKKGDLGTVYTSILYDGKLYLGTNQGLFYKVMASNDRFKFIEGTKGQVWSLKAIGDTLFCGHNLGTFVVKDDQVQLVASIPGTWDIQPFLDNENLVIQGNYGGLHVLHRQNGAWSFRNKLEGFDISSKYFASVDANKLLVSHEYKGVFEITTDNDWTKVQSVIKDTSVEKGFGSSLVNYLDKILYAYENGVFVYDKQENKFEKDSLLSTMFSSGEYTSGKLISDIQHDKLWGFSQKNISYVSPGKFSEQPIITRIPLPKSLRKEMVGYETISFLSDDTYLFGTSSGYIIIDINKIDLKSYDVAINSIANYAINGEAFSVDVTEPSHFKTNQNNLQFNYSVAEYYKYLEAEYQYKLIGYYDEWSPWSSQSSVLFKNLPHGEYTLKVRSKVGDKLSNNEAIYEFEIAKPWYISNLMIFLYIIILIVLGVLVHYIYKRYYKKQKEKLILKNKRDIDLRELESEQQLMQLKNEKLHQDIENKNRELAISTMSLIKKNEFLNQIKEELKNTNDQASVKPVIKIIDKNINTTDDWKFFQEAFDNADKDFLKKIKSKHPKLTPNDLKLCAYLRLNLSSKEIAPLLNISHRSVEVKRYRLRKKMDLPHEASLTNYILDL